MSRWLSLPLVLALSLVARAADEPKRERPLQASPEELIKKFDKNGDGKLDAAELGEMMAALRDRAGDAARPPAGAKPEIERALANILERLDSDKDGKVSKDEAKGPLAENFARFDKNNDGKLDKDELRPAAERLASGGGAPPGKPDLDKAIAGMLEKMDKNKDGKISKEEAQGPLAEFFDRLDRNKDGSLDKDELRPAAERLAGGQREGGQPATPRGPEFDPIDKDADGRLTPEELKGSPLADKFTDIDANKDGKIDRKEFDAFVSKR